MTLAKIRPQIAFADIDKKLDSYYPQMEQHLLELLRYPTERGDARPNAPFGQPIADSLAYLLGLAQAFGFETGNMDGYMGLADLAGQTEAMVGVLTHVDVVPANPNGWQYAPYDPCIAEGRIYGRGTVDDKGPAIASLYAARALKECGYPLRRSLRLMFGADEEVGFECINHYLAHKEPPEIGFTPDGYFPLVIGEKGLGMYQLSHSWSEQPNYDKPLRLLNITAGNKGNVVPDQAEATLEAAADIQLSGMEEIGLYVKQNGRHITITATGRACHASIPEEGDNALAKILVYLSKLDFAPAGAKHFVDTSCRLFAESRYGVNLGIAGGDQYSRLTTVPAILRVGNGHGSLTCDIRFPVTRNSAYYRQKLAAVAVQNGVELEFWRTYYEPILAKESDPVAHGLLKAYRDFSGDLSEPLIVGGCTYAKCIPNFLAFGPIFPGTPNLTHQVDEYIPQDELLKCAKIYARAMYELAQ